MPVPSLRRIRRLILIFRIFLTPPIFWDGMRLFMKMDFKTILPVQYGVNILEWNPGSEDRLDKKEGDTGSAQNVYCYQADPVICSTDSAGNQITFFAYEWVNPRFGKKIKEVNICGSVNYQATQTDYGKPEYNPMKSNAILLAGLTKVKKTMPFIPKARVKQDKNRIH